MGVYLALMGVPRVYTGTCIYRVRRTINTNERE